MTAHLVIGGSQKGRWLEGGSAERVRIMVPTAEWSYGIEPDADEFTIEDLVLSTWIGYGWRIPLQLWMPARWWPTAPAGTVMPGWVHRVRLESEPIALNRPHATCLDVTAPWARPRAQWLCGPECPPS